MKSPEHWGSRISCSCASSRMITDNCETRWYSANEERDESCVYRIRLYAHLSHECSLPTNSEAIEKLDEESLMLLIGDANTKVAFKIPKHLQRTRELLSQN